MISTSESISPNRRGNLHATRRTAEEVVWAGFTPSYGNHVRIQHDGDLVTLYAHMKELKVSVGDKVFQGQQIGIMGHTGAAYGTHLHFEVRHGTVTTDPMKCLPETERCDLLVT